MQLAEKITLAQFSQTLRIHAQSRPHQCAAIVRQRQQGHRPLVGEALEGHAVVRFTRGDVGDQCALVVRARAHVDAQLFAQPGTAAIGEHREVAFQRGFIVEGQAIAIGQRFHARDFRRAAPRDHVFVEVLPQALAEPGVFHHVTERWHTLFHRRQARGGETATVGDMNLFDRLGAAGNFLPHAQALINLPRAERQRRRAGVVARLPAVAGSERFDQDDFPALRLGPGLQRQRQTGADQTATDDCQIDSTHAACVLACAISASISATVFGTPLVRMSQPDRVTTTSSSMRTPMPRHFFATF